MPFVGRRDETRWLEEQLDAALAGTPRVALICGDAGMGKTRMLTDFRPRLAGATTVAIGHSYEHATPAYMAVGQILTVCASEHPDALASLEAGDASSIRRLLGTEDAPPDAPADPDADRVRLFLASARFLLACAQRRPLALIVEDLHWIDTSSLDLLSHFIASLGDVSGTAEMPVVMYVTHRASDAPARVQSAVARWEREQSCRRLDLQGLSEMETSVLIEQMGLGRPSHQLVSTILRATRGNPLFVQEAMRFLDRSGSLEERGGSLVSTVPPAEIQLPGEVLDAIRARIEGLDETCRTTLTLAALVGDVFNPAVLEPAAELPAATIASALEQCAGDGLLISRGEEFQFAHPLIRHACHEAVVGPRRGRMHAQIADGLEKRYADSVDDHVPEIAHHLIAAGSQVEAERTLEYAKRAGDETLALYAWGGGSGLL